MKVTIEHAVFAFELECRRSIKTHTDIISTLKLYLCSTWVNVLRKHWARSVQKINPEFTRQRWYHIDWQSWTNKCETRHSEREVVSTTVTVCCQLPLSRFDTHRFSLCGPRRSHCRWDGYLSGRELWRFSSSGQRYTFKPMMWLWRVPVTVL